MTRLLLLYLLVNIAFAAHAQDPQLSHWYAVPMQIGPSFAGSAGATRFAINGRDQWMSVKREHVNYSVMADHHLYGTRTGIGIMYMSDYAGDGYLTTNSLVLQYAVSLPVTDKFSLRPGLQASYNQRKIDYSKITFGDQLDFIDNRPESIEENLEEKVNYADFSASLLAIYTNYWMGATMHHIGRPDQSLLGGEMRIPYRFVGYMGGRLSFKTMRMKKRGRENVYLMLHYSQQEKYRQGYAGAHWEHGQMISGIWYRGLPFMKAYEKNINSDALVLMLGMRWGNLMCLYSYDFSLSKLIVASGGSHEVTLTWKWANEKLSKKKSMTPVACPGSEGAELRQNQQKNQSRAKSSATP